MRQQAEIVFECLNGEPKTFIWHLGKLGTSTVVLDANNKPLVKATYRESTRRSAGMPADTLTLKKQNR